MIYGFGAAAGVLLIAAALRSETATAQTGNPPVQEPWELTRSLQVLQDQIAIGSEAANSAQRDLLIHIGQQLLSTDPEAWGTPANARAAVVYALSGGQPEVIRRLIAADGTASIERKVLEGALAYTTGHQDAARSLLESLDPRELAPSLGAHLALVQAHLAMETDPEKAIRLLETVRLLAPGTLLEEAALRRQIAATSALSDTESFVFLARQYIRRFKHSVYFRNFLGGFLPQWKKLELPQGQAELEKFATTVEELELADRRSLYLALAQEKLLAGESTVARAAAARASVLSEAGSGEELRAQLYEAAAQVAIVDPAQGLTSLMQIDRSQLSKADADLRDAAIAIAEQVRQEPDQKQRRPLAGSEDLPNSAVLESGRKAVAAASALLERTK